MKVRLPKSFRLFVLLAILLYCLGLIVYFIRKPELAPRDLNPFFNTLNERFFPLTEGQPTKVTGRIIDEEGRPIQEYITLYFVYAKEWESITGSGSQARYGNFNDLIETGKLVAFTSNNDGTFEHTLSSGDYYIVFEGFWMPVQPGTIGRVRLRGGEREFEIQLKRREPSGPVITYDNSAKERERRSFYTVTLGDTLWSIAEDFYSSGMYWPVIARMNDGIRLSSQKNVLIEEGSILFIPKLSGWYDSSDVLSHVRNVIKEGMLYQKVKYKNKEYSYEFYYPSHWLKFDSVGDYYLPGAIQSMKVVGPSQYPWMNSYDNRPTEVIVAVYKGTDSFDINRFLVNAAYIGEYTLKSGHVVTKESADGGISIESGQRCAFICPRYKIYFRNNTIYSLIYPNLDDLREYNEKLFLETAEIIESFEFINEIEE